MQAAKASGPNPSGGGGGGGATGWGPKKAECMEEGGAGWVRCGGCGLACRPGVLMFNDSEPSLLAHLRRREDLYVAWECAMERAVRFGGEGGGGEDEAPDGAPSKEGRACVALLEIGCGLRVPTVRMESEAVLGDLLDELVAFKPGLGDQSHPTDEAAAHVTLVRLNTDYPEIPLPPPGRAPSSAAARAAWPTRTVQLRMGALRGLGAIDAAITRLAAIG